MPKAKSKTIILIYTHTVKTMAFKSLAVAILLFTIAVSSTQAATMPVPGT